MLLLTVWMGCGGTLCEGRVPSEATELELQLFNLGYGEFDGDTGGGFGDREVIEDASDWEAHIAAMGVDPTGGVDFDTHAVFLNEWVDGGCSEPYEYEAYALDDELRVRAIAGEDGGCDAYFPELDVVVVERGGATDLSFCE